MSTTTSTLPSPRPSLLSLTNAIAPLRYSSADTSFLSSPSEVKCCRLAAGLAASSDDVGLTFEALVSSLIQPHPLSLPAPPPLSAIFHPPNGEI
eukprot:582546-Hanusia_phi.AAC.1